VAISLYQVAKQAKGNSLSRGMLLIDDGYIEVHS
jgi:hypothetical protein